MKKIIFFAMFLVFISVVNASTLGSIVENNYVRLRPGETYIFKASFFNLDKETHILNFEIEKPQGWDVTVKPWPSLVLPGGKTTKHPKGSGWVYLPSTDAYTPAYPVFISVTVPPDEGGGDYSVTLFAYLQPKSAIIKIGQKVTQARSINFRIYVSGAPKTGNRTSMIFDLGNVIKIIGKGSDTIRKTASKLFDEIKTITTKGIGSNTVKINTEDISDGTENVENNQITGMITSEEKKSITGIVIIVVVLILSVIAWIFLGR